MKTDPTDTPKRSWPKWVLLTLLVIVVAYPLSVGPLAYFCQRHASREHAFQAVYAPVTLAATRNQRIERWLDTYLRMWGAKDIMVGPRARTMNSMNGVENYIYTYLITHKHLPPTLTAVALPGTGYDGYDAWGRELSYTIYPDGTFVLQSLGHDGAPGGSGEDADVTRRYKVGGTNVTILPR